MASYDSIFVFAPDDRVDEPDEAIPMVGFFHEDDSAYVLGDPSALTLVILDNDDPPPVTLSLSDAEISENGGAATVSASLAWPSVEPTTVDLAVRDDGGAESVRLVSRRLTIPARERRSTGSVALVAVNNDVRTGDVTATITGTAHNSLGAVDPEPLELTVLDDDAVPKVRLALAPAAIGEAGGVSRVTAALDRAASEATAVTVAAVAIAPAAAGDFTLSANRVLSIAAGQTASTGTVTVTAVDNGARAAHKQVQVSATVSGGNGAGAPDPRTLTIHDDETAPTLTLALAKATIAEAGGSTTVSARLDHPAAADVTVTVTAAPVAPAAAGDFTLSTNRVLTIAAGQTAGTGVVSITAVDDALVSRHKEVRVGATVSGGGVAAPASLTLRIEDDEDAPALGLVLSRDAVTEGVDTSFVTVTLAPAPAVQRVVAVSATAVAPATADDFTLSGSTLTIPAGAGTSDGSIAVATVDNTVYTPPRQVTLTARAVDFRAAGPASGTLTIRDDDEELSVELRLSAASIDESGGAADVTAHLDNVLEEPVTLTVAATPVAPATAADFSLEGATLTIAAGARVSTGSVRVVAVDNAVDAPDKSVQIAASVSSAALAPPVPRTLTIADDESTPVATLELSDRTVGESGGAALVTARIDPPSSAETTVTVSVRAEAPATDAEVGVSDNRTLVIASGASASTGVVRVFAVGDTIDQPNKSILVEGTAHNVHGVAAPGAVALTIVDDEPVPVLTLDLSEEAIDESGGSTAVTARLSGASSDRIAVSVAAEQVDGSVPDGFTVSTDPVLTIAAGQTSGSGTVTITAVSSSTYTGDREVRVTGAVEGGRGVAPPDGRTLTVRENETAPVLALDLAENSIAENAGSVRVRASLTGTVPGGPVTLTVLAEPEPPASAADFTQSGTTLRIAAGANASTGMVRIVGVDDELYDPGETVRITAEVDGLSLAAPPARTLTISDDESSPVVTLALSRDTIGENGGVSVVSGASNVLLQEDLTITVTTTPVTAATTDFSVSSNRVLTIRAGEKNSLGLVAITAVDDDVDEDPETLKVGATVQGAQSVAAPEAVELTIQEGEATPGLTLVLDPATIGENGESSRVKARLAHLSGEDTVVTIAAAPFAPASGSYFTLSTNTTLTIAAGATGSTGTVTVTAVNDDVENPRKLVRVEGKMVSGGHGVAAPEARYLSIDDDDGTPTLRLTLSPSSISEKGGTTVVTASLTGVTTEQTTALISVRPVAPAVAGDFSLSGNPVLTIAAGATESTGTVTITGVDNAVDGPDKSVLVGAAVTGGNGVADPEPVDLTIADDEPSPTATLALSANPIGESGGSARVTASLAYETSEDTILTVTASPHDPASGSYFTQAGTTLTIAAGATSSTGTVTVSAVNDELDSPDKTVRVTATASGGNGVAAPAAVDLTIEDGDATPVLTLALSASAIDEDGGAATVTASLGHGSSEATLVTVTVTPTAPAAEGDFALSDDPVLTIAAGATESTGTVTITAVDNAADTPDRELVVGATVAGSSGVAAPATLPLKITDDDVTPTASLVLTPAAIDEDGGSSLVTAVLDHPSSAVTTITVTAAALSPPSGAYFTQTGATLTIAAGSTTSTGTVTLTAVDDPIQGPARKLVRVSGAAANDHGVAGPAAVDLQIDDDETQLAQTESEPPLKLVLVPDRIDENGGVSTVLATLRRPYSETAVLTVQAAADSPPEGDYFVQSGATLTIAAGRTNSTGTVTVTAVDDAVAGPDKTVEVSATVTGGNGVAAPPDRTLTIADDEGPPGVTLVIAPAVIGENGEAARVTARLSHAAGEDTTMTVAVAPVAPAVAGDFTLSANLKLTVAANTTTSSGTVTITAVDDSVDAPDKQVEVTATVSGGNGATAPAKETLAIIDDEDTPAVTMALAASEVAEEGGSTTVTASLGGPSSHATTVTVTAAAELPAAGSSFTQSGTTLTIAAGQTASVGTVTIAAVGDTVDGPERKQVRVRGAAANGHAVTGPPDLVLEIVDDDALPTVTLVLDPAEIGENGGESRVRAQLSHPSSAGVTLAVSTAPKEPATGQYVTQTGTTLAIAAGATTSTGEVIVRAVDDRTDSANKLVEVTAAATGGNGVANPAAVELTITDDDALPVMTLVLEPNVIGENGGSSRVHARLGHPSDQATTVTVAATPTAPAVAGDFALSATTTLTIAAGATKSTGAVAVTAVDDDLDNPDKIVQVSATASGGRGVEAPAQQRLTITDDDGTPSVTLVLAPAEIAENGGSSRVTAVLSAAASVATTLQVAVTPNAPAVAGDFSLSDNRMLTIDAGQTGSSGTVTIRALDNGVDAPDRTLTVGAAVTGVTGTSDPAARILTINDDDATPQVTLVLTPEQVSEQDGESVVTATLSAASSAATTVTVRAAQVGARAAEYFTLSADPVLSIAAGATDSTGTVRIGAIDDTTDGPDRKVRVTGLAANVQGAVAPAARELVIADDDALPVARLLLSSGSIAENGGTTRVTARLTHPSTEAVTLTVTADPVAPATAGDVRLGAAHVLTIAAGATDSTGTVTVTAVDDTVDAPDKQVRVGATATGGNGVAAPAAVTLVVADDDPAPAVSLTLNPATIGENGGVSSVTATLGHPSSAATTVTVSAAAHVPPTGAYFTQSGTTLTIAAGQTASTGTVTIAAVDDGEDGPDKQVRVSATAANDQGATDPAARLLNITDEEVPPTATLVLTPDEIDEGGVSVVTATLAYASSAATTLTVTASAHDPPDGSYFTQSGDALTIAAGQTASTGSVTVTALDDSVYEADRTVRVAARVTDGKGVLSPASRDLTIADDEAVPVVTLALSENSVAESGDPVTVTASLSGATGTETVVTVTAAAHDPPDGAYFTQTGTTLTIAAGQTANTGTVTIAPVDDDVDQPDRTVRVTATVAGDDDLAAPDALDLTITDDEETPTVTLALSEPSVLENGDPVTVSAALSGKTGADTVLTVTASAHDPPDGAYFTQTGTTLTIAAGQTASTGVVAITPSDDDTSSPDRTVSVAATAAGGNGVAAPDAVRLRILEDDGPPRMRFALSENPIDEDGGSAVLTVALSHPSSRETTAAITLTPAATEDTYTVAGGLTLTIAASRTVSGGLTITAVDDDVDDPDLKIAIVADVGDDDVTPPEDAELTIRDDEATSQVTLALSAETIAESGGTTTVTAELEPASNEQTTVTVTVSPVAPAAAADFVLSAGPVLTIAAGATASTGTVTVTAVANDRDEPDKTVTVEGEAANSQGARHPEGVTLTITDDDSPPTFGADSATRSLAENTAIGEAVGDPVTATDVDGDVPSYHLGEEEDALAFLIDALSGQLRTLIELDFEAQNVYRFTVQARDPGGNSADIAVTVNVTDEEEPPAAPAAPTVTPAGLTSLHATWTPPVNTGPAITDYDYRYRASDPAGDWTEVTDGTSTALEVTIAGLDENTGYDVQVRATNAEGTGAWSASGTGMTDHNAWPVFTPESALFHVVENQTSVGTVAASDADEEDSVTGYALTGGVDRALFSFDAASRTLAFRAAPNYEAPRDAASTDPPNQAGDNIYVLVVSATSGAGDRVRTTERAVQVIVTDKDEPPGAPDAEVTPASTSSLEVRWDPPPNQGPPVEDYDYRYRPAAAPSAAEIAAAQPGTAVEQGTLVRRVRQARVEAEASWTEVVDTVMVDTDVTITDLRAGAWYEVQVRAVNAEGRGPWSPAEAARTEMPQHVPLPPVLPPVTPPVTPQRPTPPANSPPEFEQEEAAFSVPENTTEEVATMTARDPDEQDEVTGYAITGGADARWFALDQESGALAFREPPNYEDPRDAESTDPPNEAADNIYVVEVSATSGTGDRERSTAGTVTVAVTDVDEPPAAPPAPAVTGTSTSTLLVRWEEPQNTGPPIDDYDYRYRRHDPPGAWTEVTDTTITEREATIAGLAMETSYDVQVRASNDEGTGPWSASGTAATLAPRWNYVAVPWLARFARTATGHVLDGVGERFAAGAAVGAHAAIAGHALRPGDRTDGDPLDAQPFRNMEFHELLAGSSFSAAPASAGTEQHEDAGRWSLWGRGDWSSFAGVEPGLTLEGSVLTSTVGADYTHGSLVVGLALAYSTGDGAFRADDGESGRLSGRLLSVHPYLHATPWEPLAVWGLLGLGALGDLGVAPDAGDLATAGVGLLMGAAGAEVTLLPAAQPEGIEVTARTDALLLSARADGEGHLIRAQADVSRVRMMLRVGYRDFALLGGVLSPSLEGGVRYDDGSAERGAGLVLGGSLNYELPAWGLTMTAEGRGLLLHRDTGFEEWHLGGSLRFDPGAPGLGLAVSVAPAWGSGSATPSTLWTLADASSLAPRPAPVRGDVPVPARLETELSYGIAAGEGVLTPYMKVSGSPRGEEPRTWRAGVRLRVTSVLDVSFDGAQSERPHSDPVHSFSVSGTARF